MIYTKNFDNKVYSIVLKIENIIFVFLKKNSVNMRIKNNI